jgi:hypothetical protein
MSYETLLKFAFAKAGQRKEAESKEGVKEFLILTT